MLPFTTYKIPEITHFKTAGLGKWLCIVVPAAISDAELDLLKKISTALHADFSQQTQLINQDNGKPISLSENISDDTRLVISFGVPPADLGLWIDLQRPGLRVMESFTFILSLPLKTLSDNIRAKKELWNYMQMYLDGI